MRKQKTVSGSPAGATPTDAKIAELKEATRRANETLKDLHQLHKDIISTQTILIDDINTILEGSKDKMDKLIKNWGEKRIEEVVTGITKKLSADVAEARQFVIDHLDASVERVLLKLAKQTEEANTLVLDLRTDPNHPGEVVTVKGFS